MSKNYSVIPFSRSALESIFGPTHAKLNRIDYLNEYFEKLMKEKSIKNITIVKEEEYIDKFYLRDYSRYYAEAFEIFPNRSQRIHFFSRGFDEEEFKNILVSGDNENLFGNDDNKVDKKCEYLGHITVKPVKDDENSSLMGRSVLAPYPNKEGDNNRFYLTAKNQCSLYGIDLILNSIPFHEQDMAVGACASACLWMSQFIIENWFSIPVHSLAEITEMSRLKAPYTAPAPLYPSEGLTPAEVVAYTEQLNLHFHVIRMEDIIENATDDTQDIDLDVIDELIQDIIKAYFNAGFPIICGLDIYEKYDESVEENYYDGHAALLTGYKEDKDEEIIELYLHDDRIGPYCRTKFFDTKFDWNNNWITSGEAEKVILSKFIIPVDPLVKLNFLWLFPPYHYIWKENSEKAELKIYHISSYKKSIFNKKFKNKEKILSRNMPRYVWVLHLYENDDKNISRDVIFDANRILLREPIEIVEFI